MDIQMANNGRLRDALVANIIELNEIIKELKKALNNREIPERARNILVAYDKEYLEFIKQVEGGVVFEKLQPICKAITGRLSSITKEFDDSFYKEDHAVSRICIKLVDALADTKALMKEGLVTYNYTGSTSDESDISQRRAALNKLAKSKNEKLSPDYNVLLEELKVAQEVYSKKDAVLRKKLGELEIELDSVSKKTEETISNVNQQYIDAKDSLTEKQARVDSLIETISEKVVAGNYEDSASKEKKSADWLRTTSLIFMSVIAVVTAYSLYETTLDSFKWENSIFRLVFIVLVSVPAAYLARESDKHRKLMNKYLQISLDLKAMDPFMASLPLDEQHRLKSEVALRIFGSKSDESNLDSYPISIHDLLSKLIERIDVKAISKEGKGGG